MKRALSLLSATLIAVPALALLTTNLRAQGNDPWQALPQWQFGQSREPLATIEEQIRKGGSGERPQIERRLLEILQAPSTTKDSRRFICRWLGIVGSEKSVAPLAALLADPDLSHPARIALEALPNPAAGEALVAALPKLTGNLLIGAISSIGTKRVPGAVPELAKLAGNPEPGVARAALVALGEVGTESASQALAAAKVSPALSRDVARARITVAGRLANSGKRPQAVAVYEELMGNSSQPPAIRLAAFQGLAASLPSKDAATLIVNALEGGDPLFASAAVKAFEGAGEARQSVGARVANMQPRAQLLLLGIIADARDLQARQALVQIAETGADPAVKAAAVDCLATHGTAEDVALIAKLAAGQDPMRAAARRTLQRISGPGVDAALIRLIESGDGALRKAVMEAVPSRRMESALPALQRLARGSDPAAATDAARTIGQMGGTAQIKDLARLVTSTSNDAVREAAQEAIKSICARAEDPAAAAGVIQAELAGAATPAARAALLPLTVYTGGEAGLSAVLKGMQDQDAEVRRAAFRALVAWPEARAGSPLLRFAETNAEPSQAIVALRDGCLRLAEMDESPASERAAILQGVTRIAKRPEEKKRAVSLMAQVPSPALLEALPRLAADPALRPEAVGSAVQLARALGAVYPRQSLAALEDTLKVADTPELRKTVENGIKAVRNAGQSPEGYILGWMVAGPFTQADKDSAALFDVAFAPEKPGGTVEWRPLAAPPNGMVDLGKPMPGENRVAYLRATVHSEQDQKSLLELGSDDGVKVWLNGEVVHANNTVRPCSPGQDKVTVNLKQGDNLLLLKITQGGGEFAAVARLRAPDGGPLPTVMVGSAKD